GSRSSSVRQGWGAGVCLKSRRLAVAPWIARGDIPLDCRIAQSPDELAGAEILIAVLNDFDLVAELAQLKRGRARHRRLHIDRQPFIEAPARRIAGRLRLLPVH